MMKYVTRTKCSDLSHFLAKVSDSVVTCHSSNGCDTFCPVLFPPCPFGFRQLVSCSWQESRDKAVGWEDMFVPLHCGPSRGNGVQTQRHNNMQKTRQGCGCPNFLAGRVFRQMSTLLELCCPCPPRGPQTPRKFM